MSRGGWPIAALAGLFALAYSVYGLFRHWHFGSSAYDLGIFDQAVWHLSRLEAPSSTISGFSNILGDHFYPVIALFAPLYRIAPGPETLIVAQACLFALSIAPVALFLGRRLPWPSALVLSAAYGLFWGMQRAVAFDVHEIAFAPVVIATAILAMERKRWGLLWAACVLLALVKEDLIPLLPFFGLLLLARGERRGWVLLVGGPILFVIVVGVIVPALSDSGRYNYGGVFAEVIARPWTIPATLVTPPVKAQTALLWLLPFAMLPLGSPLAILLIPLALSRLLSASPYHWGTTFHYSAPLAPILAMAAGDGLARLARRIGDPGRRSRAVAWTAAACLVLAAVLPGRQPLWRLFTPRHYAETSVHRAGYRALALIPPDASVVAQAAIVPHLSRRREIRLLDAKAPDADYLVVSADLNPWPATAFSELAGLVEARRGKGYAVVFSEEGWTVLRREPPRQAAPGEDEE